jgi:L-lactate dehydrogenase
MKIGVVGAGAVGVGVVNALVMMGIGREILLYNRTLKKAEGEAFDLEDAVPLLSGDTRIVATEHLEDLAVCGIVVVTVGANQKPGQSRRELVTINAAIVRDIVSRLDEIAPEAILLIVTNPVDALTRVAMEVSKRPPHKVFGSGTVLDTIRLKEALGKSLDINRHNIHTYIVGEHGDNEFALWSAATIGPMALRDMPIENLEEKEAEVEERVRRRAYEIIDRKGYTQQGVGVAVARIVEAVIEDRKRVYTLSTRASGCHGCELPSDAVFSQPCVVGKAGVERTLMVSYDEREFEKLRKAIDAIDVTYRAISS